LEASHHFSDIHHEDTKITNSTNYVVYKTDLVHFVLLVPS